MITLQGKLPRKIYVACSGGVDSLAALHFLSRNHDVTALHVNHNEGNSDDSEDVVRALCADLGCGFSSKRITATRPTRCSLEEFWRNERYNLFHSINDTVVTAHTLDDAIETWIWSSLHGIGKIIPYANRNVIRPFRLTPKRQFVSWATKHNLIWVEDSSNADLTLSRNYIRTVMMPHVLCVNPGISTTIKKKVKQDYVEPRVCTSYYNFPLPLEVCNPC
jgi:tRNA(Ile)-lysidine synthetase-like protein